MVNLNGHFVKILSAWSTEIVEIVHCKPIVFYNVSGYALCMYVLLEIVLSKAQTKFDTGGTWVPLAFGVIGVIDIFVSISLLTTHSLSHLNNLF